MDVRDHNYLSLQFWLKIHQLSGTAFQQFAEGILEKAYPNFRKIKPHGNLGDQGNDGYRKAEGIYYQMYSPQEPSVNQAEAARKAKEDFAKLKDGWSDIAEVRQYYFVFNDKNTGSSLPLEQALAELQRDNSAIEFKIFTARDLELVFFSLRQQDILSLGFDIDTTKAVGMFFQYLDHVKTLVDRGNGKLAESALAGLKTMLSGVSDEGLAAEIGLLHCNVLQLTEHSEEAVQGFERLIEKYTTDVRPLIGLASIYLDREDFAKHQELLERARLIDRNHTLIRLQGLLYSLRRQQPPNLTNIDESTFPDERRLKSSFYRIYAALLGYAGDTVRAERFVQRAIELNPDRLHNYYVKLETLQANTFRQVEAHTKETGFRSLLEAIVSLENQARAWGDLSPRTEAYLNCLRIIVLQQLDEVQRLLPLAKPTAHLIMKCSFDQMTDHLLVQLVHLTEWPPEDFAALQDYLKMSVAIKPPSATLSKMMVFQFLLKGLILTEGRQFFAATNHSEMLTLITAIDQNDYDAAWKLLSADLPFAVMVASAAKGIPQLRWKIVENLPDNKDIQKDKLLLLLNFEEDKVDEAFQILRTVDLSTLGYAEAEFILKLAQKKEAWEFVVTLLEKLLAQQSDKQLLLQRKLQLLQALFNLERYTDASAIGEEILDTKDKIASVPEHLKEWLLGQTILARYRHGEYKKAQELLEKHHELVTSAEFQFGLEPHVYLSVGAPEHALAAVVAGLRRLGSPTPEEYGSLFYITASIGNALSLGPESLVKVIPGCFVKVQGQERWYFIGDGQPLDATKIDAGDAKYAQFIDRQVGDTITIPVRYSSTSVTYTVEIIFPVEQYVCWRSAHDAQQLTREHRWDKMEMVEIPSTGDKVDPTYLIARLEDERQKSKEIFDLYCKQLIPLAFLAVSQGGLTGAIGIISNEERGFIHCCPNDATAVARQRAAARRLLAGDDFYIDATSAIFFAETGLLPTLQAYLPGIRVPQTVISFLLETSERFTPTPGQVGHMQYVQQRLRYSPTDAGKADELRRRFRDSIAVLESKPDRVAAISSANKADCVSEQRVPPALTDACILAQRDNTLVLTEDYLYLQANELETGKAAPSHCSTFIVMQELLAARRVTYDQYLEYFYYLASYRCQFLSLSAADLEKAVFGDGPVAKVRPERIRIFNFQLTLSEEYGVALDTALRVVTQFVAKLIVDDSLLPDLTRQIYAEILTTFPARKDKRIVGRTILEICNQAVQSIEKRVVVGTRVKEKLAVLAKYTESIIPGTILIP